MPDVESKYYYEWIIFIFNALLRQNIDTLSSDHYPADDDNMPGPGRVT